MSGENGVMAELETVGARKLATRKRRMRWGSIVAASLTALGGGGVGVWKAVDARAETVALAKAEERLSSHDRELELLMKRLDGIEAALIGLRVDQARIAGRLGVEPSMTPRHP